MKEAIKLISKLIKDLNLYSVVKGEYKGKEIQGYTVFAQHPFFTIRININKTFVGLRVTNRFTSEIIITNITALSEVDESCQLLRAYVRNYVVSEVIK
jgi:hypothetical protein